MLLPLLFIAAQVVTITAERTGTEPVLTPGPSWSHTGAFNPAVVQTNGRTVMLFRATDAKMTSRIGYAESQNGSTFTMRGAPVLQPEAAYEKDGGVEDPRLVLIGSTFYLTYTGYNRIDAQLCLATSTDLIHWTRKGVLLPANKGTWNTKWTKSGAIVPSQLNGLWWMYYLGTRTDPDGKDRDYMGLASSPDLEHWTDATKVPVLPRRPGAFDSRVMEPGPTPLVTSAGILVLYNGASEDLVYGPAWALFDKTNPAKLLARADRPFLLPSLPWEKTGVVPNVIFLEGAIFSPEQNGAIEGTGYYGAADRFVGAARIHIRVRP